MEVGDALELRQFRAFNPTAIVSCLPAPTGMHCNGGGDAKRRKGDECGKNPEKGNEYNFDTRNLGNQSDSDYWGSVDTFLDQASMILPPKGLLVIQSTNYVRDGEVIRLDYLMEEHLQKMDLV